MRIVLDAMGTDNRPIPDIAGGVLAARHNTADTIIFIGDSTRIQTALDTHDTQGLSLEIVHAEEEITMDDSPSEVLKSKPHSSIHQGMRLVKSGDADAFVTMGNTGAVQAVATLGALRRIPGIKRPALATVYVVQNKPIVMLDMGANADARAEWLEQFAIMGSIYAQTVLGYATPRVATLSNGEEEGKGNQLVREAGRRLKALDLNYIGNVEPAELMTPAAEVIVFDGFVGNIFLKTFEGTLTYMGEILRDELSADWLSRIGALLARQAFRRVRTRLNPDDIGGAPLLGVNGVVVIGHGSASPQAILGSINQARKAVQGKTVETIQAGMAKYRR